MSTSITLSLSPSAASLSSSISVSYQPRCGILSHQISSSPERRFKLLCQSYLKHIRRRGLSAPSRSSLSRPKVRLRLKLHPWQLSRDVHLPVVLKVTLDQTRECWGGPGCGRKGDCWRPADVSVTHMFMSATFIHLYVQTLLKLYCFHVSETFF